MAKQRLLITGVSGLLGGNLAGFFRDKYDVLGVYNTHTFKPAWVVTEQVDLTSEESCARVVAAFRPDVCIHCAALADVDRCEVDRAAAYRINVEATRFLVKALSGRACQLVFISTDSVYDGTGGKLSESSPVRPQNYYAETKLLAESEVARHPDSLIVRTSFLGWNLGEGKLSIAQWAVEELSNGRRIKGFTDVRTSSIYTMAFARILEAALQKQLKGVYNIAASDSLSKCELLFQIARLFKLDEGLIDPVAISSFPLKAKRPLDLSLVSDKVAGALGITLPSMAEGVEEFYRDREKFWGKNKGQGRC
ncbi:MAG: SDR family oxidoreductase [Candidatus Omnitrophica bacterium]|nr:SDR family oxidoreductase [Candidatus Omnitrophota bacterium]